VLRGPDLQAASEAIVSMGERSGGQAVTASRVRGGAVGDREDTEGDRALAETLSHELDLSSEMTRNELDAYERAVIGGGAPSASSGSMMPVAITVPPGYSAGQSLKVRCSRQRCAGAATITSKP